MKKTYRKSDWSPLRCFRCCTNTAWLWMTKDYFNNSASPQRPTRAQTRHSPVFPPSFSQCAPTLHRAACSGYPPRGVPQHRGTCAVQRAVCGLPRRTVREWHSPAVHGAPCTVQRALRVAPRPLQCAVDRAACTVHRAPSAFPSVAPCSVETRVAHTSRFAGPRPRCSVQLQRCNVARSTVQRAAALNPEKKT